ncbi:hypothetical protein POV27_15185 [Aureisphaera galaxeae]|uniref:hypothetical protein n=1 Tax=Aureisphaera galaxeae TaxID=1538023 RepID=UPI0023505071|nr:hypothetical protein [Aureisphaera galaxeae]MDC8005406.1 hypothetical protein [Aureisphaera galaxeae]
MSKNSSFIQLGNDGDSAPLLSYNLPESTNYVGYNVISVDLDEDYLNDVTKRELEANLAKKHNPPVRSDKSTAKDRLKEYVLKNGGRKLAGNNSNAEKRTNTGTTSKEQNKTTSANINVKYLKLAKESFNGFYAKTQAIKIKPPKEKISPKILFYERVQISNYLGNYGAGKVIKTFSLFPGEKTKISIKTYKESLTSEEQNSGSSILDSTSEEAASDFQNSLMSESSLKHNEEEVDIMYSEESSTSGESETSKSGQGNAGVLWGLVKAGGGGSSQKKSNSSQEYGKTGEWGTRTARNEFAKNVSNALSKHASRASSKRDIKINTSTSTNTSSETSKESIIEREIQNINLSSTLNLAFRQMNQEFISVTHLTDIKISLYNESGGPYPKYSLYELDRFLDDYFVNDDEKRTAIKNDIIRELYYVFNYVDQPKQFVEKKSLQFPTSKISELDLDLPEQIEFLRVKKDMHDTVLGSEHIKVKGVILNVNKIVMRTDGVLVDAFLGRGKAIDDYNSMLQNENIRKAKLTNDALAYANNGMNNS